MYNKKKIHLLFKKTRNKNFLLKRNLKLFARFEIKQKVREYIIARNGTKRTTVPNILNISCCEIFTYYIALVYEGSDEM